MTNSIDQTLVDMFLHEERVEGSDMLGGFAYQLDMSSPAIATAVHGGHRIRDELLPLMALDEAGRLFEEDAATDEMIKGVPSAIWGLDSRAEYDLNRAPQDALPLTPEQFWGTRVYQEQPSESMNRRSMAKYNAFYRFIFSYVQALVTRFGGCVVYDIHSYNISRQVEKGFENPPVFNLGTEQLDETKWRQQIDAWLKELSNIQVPDQVITAVENQVFFGRANFCRQLTEGFEDVLVLPTEVSKIYMDEHSGVLNQPVLQALKSGLQKAIGNHSHHFATILNAAF